MDSTPTQSLALVGERCVWCEQPMVAGRECLTDGHDATFCSKACFAKALDNFDPSPWCSGCGSMTKEHCHCGPIAEND